MDKEAVKIWGLQLAIILIFAFLKFGGNGVRVALVMICFFLVPAYLILSAFPLNENEVMILSWTVGLVLTASVAYPLGLLLGSLSAATWLTLAILLSIAGLLHWKVKPIWS